MCVESCVMPWRSRVYKLIHTLGYGVRVHVVKYIKVCISEL